MKIPITYCIMRRCLRWDQFLHTYVNIQVLTIIKRRIFLTVCCAMRKRIASFCHADITSPAITALINFLNALYANAKSNKQLRSSSDNENILYNLYSLYSIKWNQPIENPAKRISSSSPSNPPPRIKTMTHLPNKPKNSHPSKNINHSPK